MDLDIGLPVQELKEPLGRALSWDEKTKVDAAMLDAVSRRGKKIRTRVTHTLRLGSEGEVEGLVLLIEDETA
jgi:hypothetical protein